MTGAPQSIPSIDEMHEHARRLAQISLPVFPLRFGMKEPYEGSSWLSAVTLEQYKIKRTWGKELHNIGVATGRGIVVVDVDVKHGKLGFESMCYLEMLDMLPNTFTVQTPSGGLHLYYIAPLDQYIPNSVDRLGSGIDIRGHNGYVVGPGSVQIDENDIVGHYRIIKDIPLALAPHSLIEKCKKFPQRSVTVLPEHLNLEIDSDADIEQGKNYLCLSAAPSVQGCGGHNNLIVIIMRLLDFALSDWKIYDLLLEHWNERCEPPWTPDELIFKVQSVAKTRSGKNYSPRGHDSIQVHFAAPIAEKELALIERLDRSDRTKHGQAWATLNAADLATLPAPERQWLVPGLIPMGRVTLLTGNGGVGKTLLVQQLGAAVSAGTPWLDFEVPQGAAFGLFCEDDNGELHRRLHDIRLAAMMEPEALRRFEWFSAEQDGEDTELMRFVGNDARGKLMPAYHKLRKSLEDIEVRAGTKMKLVMIDSAADVFGGSEIIRPQVSSFMQICLGAIARETGAAVILLAHPSQTGINSGAGTFGSTAWNNKVRSRLYLSRPDDQNGKQYRNDGDIRLLSTMKANYGQEGQQLVLRWRGGMFQRIRAQEISSDQRKNKAKEAYLAALNVIEARGGRVHPHKSQVEYGPKQFLNMIECVGLSKLDLEEAQEALFREDKIRIETTGCNSRARQRITVCAAPLATGARFEEA